MNEKSYKFKPCRLVTLYTLIFILKIIFPIYIGAFLYPQEALLPVIIVVSSLIALYFSYRILYRIKYIIDDEYLTAYQGKKIFLKIKKSDIEYVCVKKGHWYDIFLFDFFSFLGVLALSLDFFSDEFSNISFVYKKFEIKEKRKVEILRRAIRPEELKDWHETVEIFSYRQSKKICKLLGKEPIIVKKANLNVEAD